MPVHQLNGYRVVDLTKVLDPRTERRRLRIERFKTTGHIPDYQSNMDIMSHLGTHVEGPYHRNEAWPDINSIEVTAFMGRCVLLNFNDMQENSYIGAADLDRAAQGRVGAGDIVIMDSPYPLEPFTEKSNTPEDNRLLIGRETAEWLAKKDVKAVGFGDGVSIEGTLEDVGCFHDILMARNVVFLEVLKNLDQLKEEVFFISFLPLPVIGLDASPVRAVAIEGLPGFSK
ncbi:cyclase family protein [Cohnella hongkongensis]|uniref:Cyclase family protein n=1 Tax=Cohnella hongkongensis TaxID=178337 RepID=A0ABV9FLA0_9BACL